MYLFDIGQAEFDLALNMSFFLNATFLSEAGTGYEIDKQFSMVH